MLRAFAFIVLGMVVSGCLGQNTNLSTLQFSEETLAFPQNYEVEAVRFAKSRGIEPSATLVSRPRTTLGETAFSPKRWYVCIRGIASSRKPPNPRAIELVEGWLRQGAATIANDVVLFFSTNGSATAREGFDAPLCRDGDYHPITAIPNF